MCVCVGGAHTSVTQRTCAYTHICTHIHIRCFPLFLCIAFFFEVGLSLSLETDVSAGLSGQQAPNTLPPPSTPRLLQPVLGLQVNTSSHSVGFLFCFVFGQFWGSNHRFSCLRGKHLNPLGHLPSSSLIFNLVNSGTLWTFYGV